MDYIINSRLSPQPMLAVQAWTSAAALSATVLAIVSGIYVLTSDD